MTKALSQTDCKLGLNVNPFSWVSSVCNYPNIHSFCKDFIVWQGFEVFPGPASMWLLGCSAGGAGLLLKSSRLFLGDWWEYEYGSTACFLKCTLFLHRSSNVNASCVSIGDS